MSRTGLKTIPLTLTSLSDVDVVTASLSLRSRTRSLWRRPGANPGSNTEADHVSFHRGPHRGPAGTSVRSLMQAAGLAGTSETPLDAGSCYEPTCVQGRFTPTNEFHVSSEPRAYHLSMLRQFLSSTHGFFMC